MIAGRIRWIRRAQVSRHPGSDHPRIVRRQPQVGVHGAGAMVVIVIIALIMVMILVGRTVLGEVTQLEPGQLLHRNGGQGTTVQHAR